ncbi:hypothetical protein [Pseudomonas izuensis]|uniref:Uncharacterized protein n=1 Tax=Pseudomonas izuensis TaxID=2684212 RepID=A0ABM7RSS0_9PSED|nr:hypothetical protein [Pseudomonas izuensis]BCX67547.1 hypothetical protein LAB08_R21820 [Pseudomonas izuensis]
MQNLKKKAALQSRADRGFGEVGARQQHAKKSGKREDFRSLIHDLMWIPSSPEHMLIL